MSSQPSSSSSSLPILHHQYIAMLYVYQRIFTYSMILPISIIIIPILLRIIYQFLKLCVVGTATTYIVSEENNNINIYNINHDVLMATTITMTIIFTHVITIKFLSIQSYLHSFSTRNNIEQQDPNDTNIVNNNDDDAASKNNTIGDVRSKENLKTNLEMNSMTLQKKDLTNLNIIQKTPFQESTHQNRSSQGINITPPTIKHDTTTTSQQLLVAPKNDNYKSLNDHNVTTPTTTTPVLNTKDSNGDNYTKTAMCISIILFLLICTLTRYFGGTYFFTIHIKNGSNSNNSHNNNITDYVLPSFITTIRLSVCMIVYGLMIALRFFGPTSIMRLSVVPLASNPGDRTVKALFNDIRKTLIRHCYPVMSDEQQQQKYPLNAKPLTHPHTQMSIKMETLAYRETTIDIGGRRYQRPTMYNTLQHIVLSLMASLTVSYIGFTPHYVRTTLSHSAGNVQLYTSTIHLVACILTALGSLLVVFDGTSHEINPYLYTNPHKAIWFHTVSTNVTRRVLYTSILVPVSSMTIAAYRVQWFVGLSYTNLLQLYGLVLLNCFGMSLYLYTYDEMIRTSLFHPRPNISKMIRQWSNDLALSTVTQLGVLLNSLLGDPSIVQEILNTPNATTRFGMLSFEKEENFFIEKHAKHMAHAFLSPIYKYAQSEALLEEDVLRIVLLEAFGGGGFRSQRLLIGERHHRLISEWIDRPTPRYQPNEMMVKYNPLSSALLRGLCVFIGGSGEVFKMLSSKTSLMAQRQTFKFSPAAFCSLELCLVAIGRCIARSLTASTGSLLSDWKCSHLSIQIPSALVSIYKLRAGVVQYSKAVNRDSANQSLGLTSNSLGGIHLEKEYGLIVQTCDSVASLIIVSMKSLQGLGRLDETLFDHDCLEWKNQLFDLLMEENIRK